MKETFSEFEKRFKNVSGSRTHKITGSHRTICGFHYYRKIRPQKKEFVLTDIQYLSIIRDMNLLIVDELISNKSVKLPCGFGRIEVFKYETTSWIDSNGRLKTNRPIDMNSTVKLWYEDEEARLNRSIVRYDSDFIFRLKYPLKGRKNKYGTYFAIQFNRDLRKKLSEAIKSGEYDTYLKTPYRQWVKQNERT